MKYLFLKGYLYAISQTLKLGVLYPKIKKAKKLFTLFVLILVLPSCFLTESRLENKPITRTELSFDWNAFTLTSLEDAGVYNGVLEENLADLSFLEKQLVQKFSDALSANDLQVQSKFHHKEIVKHFSVINDNRSDLLEEILADLVEVFEQNTTKKLPNWEIFLIKSKSHPLSNAFVTGSRIYVTEAFYSYADGDANSLSLVIGHELFHSWNNDCGIHNQRHQIATDLFGETIGNKVFNLYEASIKGVGHGRESLADVQSVQVSYMAGYSPYDGLDTYLKMASERGQDTSVFRLLSSHPIGAQRFSNLATVLERARIQAEKKQQNLLSTK